MSEICESLQKTVIETHGSLTATELEYAKRCLIKMEQSSAFRSEIEVLFRKITKSPIIAVEMS